MSAPSLKQLLANPGLPGFARFGGVAFAQPGPLAGTTPAPSGSASLAKNFPAGKFFISGISNSQRRFPTAQLPIMASRKTFLQESRYLNGLGRKFQFLKFDRRGGRVMPKTK